MKEKEVSKSKINAMQHPTRTTPTFSQRAADKLTKIIGSWAFIIAFVMFILIWIFLNAYALVNSWDVYPYILLNLTLSCIAAIQAPIILMSQNRANQKDRQRMEYDYQVDKKSQRDLQEIQKQLNRIEKRLNERR